LRHHLDQPLPHLVGQERELLLGESLHVLRAANLIE